MKIIKCLTEKIQEEIHDADDYIELALKWKTDEPEAAELFHMLSSEEMGHADRLHEITVRLIRRYREKNGEPPEAMMAVYDYLHEKQIEAATEVRIKQGMYK